MLAYWQERPPLNVMVAAYLGIGDHDGQPAEEGSDDFAGLVAELNSAGV